MLIRLIKNKHLIFSCLVVFSLVGLFFVIPHMVNAGPVEWGLSIFAWIIYTIVKFLALVLIVIIQILIAVSSYNDFINAPAIITGWAIIRDVANMFFVIILLIIAISTILGIETYNYKKLLPKLLLMAILINFSKMICGLLIDCSQVIMMTFVDGYKEAAAGNFATAFGLDQLMQFNWREQGLGEKKKINSMELIAALLLALVLVIVAISVTLGVILIFLIRIIMIWFLVVLSPIAYLCSAFPGGAKYAGQWWTDFTKYLIVGPAMAFFLWLSLIVMSTADVEKNKGFEAINNPTSEPSSIIEEGISVEGVGKPIYATVSAISSSSHLLSYIIAIGMLCGSMIMAQQLGVAGAGMAMGLAKKVGKGKMGFGVPSWTARRLKMVSGIDLNPMNYVRGFKETGEIRKNKQIMQGEAMAGKHLKAGGLRGLLLGGGATKDWANTHLQGFMFAKGLIGKPLAGGLAGGWKGLLSTPRKIEAIENKMEGVKGDMINKVINGPTEEEINTHLGQEEFSGLNKEEKQIEKDKYITDWKFNKAKEYSNGPVEEEINKRLEEKGFLTDEDKNTEEGQRARVESITDWKNEKQGEYGIEKAEAEKIDKGFKEYKNLSDQKEKVEANIPVDFYARQNEQRLISEEKQKITTSNDQELIALFKSALSDKDQYKAAAILSRATEAGHLNEMVNEFNFSSSGPGLNDFINDIMVKKVGMNQQSAYGLQNDLGYAAEHVGHWQFAQTIGVKNGRYEQRNPKDIEEAKIIEMDKRDPRTLIRDLNRLGMMKEDWIDKNDHTKGRKAEMTNIQKRHLLKYWPAYGYAFERSDANPNMMENLTDPDKISTLAQILDMLEKDKNIGENGENIKDDKMKSLFKSYKTGIKKIIKESKGKEPGKKTIDPAAELASMSTITGTEQQYIDKAKKIQETEIKPETILNQKTEVNINENLEGIETAFNQSPTLKIEGAIQSVQTNIEELSKNLIKLIKETGEELPKGIKKEINGLLNNLKQTKSGGVSGMLSLDRADITARLKEVLKEIKKIPKSSSSKKPNKITSDNDSD